MEKQKASTDLPVMILGVAGLLAVMALIFLFFVFDAGSIIS
jgi:hypothetical protein